MGDKKLECIQQNLREGIIFLADYWNYLEEDELESVIDKLFWLVNDDTTTPPVHHLVLKGHITESVLVRLLRFLVEAKPMILSLQMIDRCTAFWVLPGMLNLLPHLQRLVLADPAVTTEARRDAVEFWPQVYHALLLSTHLHSIHISVQYWTLNQVLCLVRHPALESLCIACPLQNDELPRTLPPVWSPVRARLQVQLPLLSSQEQEAMKPSLPHYIDLVPSQDDILFSPNNHAWIKVESDPSPRVSPADAKTLFLDQRNLLSSPASPDVSCEESPFESSSQRFQTSSNLAPGCPSSDSAGSPAKNTAVKQKRAFGKIY